MYKKSFSKLVMGSLVTSSLLASFAAVAAGNTLPPQDSMVTTVFDKSVIHGSLAHDKDGNLLYDKHGNARFQYTGKIYSFETDRKTGELKELDDQIGEITGEAAFPPQFVGLSAGVNALMDMMVNPDNPAFPYSGPMPPMPAVVPWTCNHCDMTAGGTHYISIVDALDPTLSDGVTKNPYYNVGGIADSFNKGLLPELDSAGNPIPGSTGASAALNTMRMDGRAFTGFGPASFDPVARTMSVRMAGCSALVAIDGPHAGKIGTLCMNATATFNVSGAIATFGKDEYGNTVQTGYLDTSAISANGSSNCVTVLQPVPAQ